MGIPHCPKCGLEIRKQSVDEIADKVMLMPVGSKIMVEAPTVRGKKAVTVPTVERGLCEVVFWSIEIAGESPSIRQKRCF